MLKTAHRIILPLCFLSLLLAACSGSSSSPPSSPPLDFTSEDGLVSLHVPAGALPEGVSASDLSITRLDADYLQFAASSDEPAAGQITVYDLQPSGIEFAQPLTFTATSSLSASDQPGFPLLLHISGDDDQDWQLTDDLTLEIDLDTQEVLVSGTLSHFSKMALAFIARGPLELAVFTPKEPTALNGKVDFYGNVFGFFPDKVDQLAASFDGLSQKAAFFFADMEWQSGKIVCAVVAEFGPSRKLSPSTELNLFPTEANECQYYFGSNHQPEPGAQPTPTIPPVGIGITHLEEIPFRNPGFQCQSPGSTRLQLIFLFKGTLRIFRGIDNNNPQQYSLTSEPGNLGVVLRSERFSCAEPTPTPSPSPSPTPDIGVEGIFRMQVQPISDPSGHGPFVGMPSTLDLTITSNPDFNVLGDPPWVNVSGELFLDGSFLATGTGTVAGYSNISARLSGVWLGYDAGFMAEYSLGVDGGLPGGDPIAFSLTGELLAPLEQAPEQGPSATATLDLDAWRAPVRDFYSDVFNPAYATADVEVLLAALHPAVIDTYGLEACRSYLETTLVNPIAVDPLAITEHGAWEFEGQLIEDVLTVSIQVISTSTGSDLSLDTHLAVRPDGTLGFFTRCTEE